MFMKVGRYQKGATTADVIYGWPLGSYKRQPKANSCLYRVISNLLKQFDRSTVVFVTNLYLII